MYIQISSYDAIARITQELLACCCPPEGCWETSSFSVEFQSLALIIRHSKNRYELAFQFICEILVLFFFHCSGYWLNGQSGATVLGK